MSVRMVPSSSNFIRCSHAFSSWDPISFTLPWFNAIINVFLSCMDGFKGAMLSRFMVVSLHIHGLERSTCICNALR